MTDHETARRGVTIIDPLGGSIAEALDNHTHRLERWNLSGQYWMRWGAGPRQREALAGRGRFLKQHGYRLVPVAPRTERVKLHQVLGRRLADSEFDFRIAEVRVTSRYPIVYGWPDGQDQNRWTRYQQPLHLGPDGEVEVLVEEPVPTVADYVNTQRAAGRGLPRENTVATQSFVEEEIRAHEQRHHYQAEALAGDLVDAQAEVLRRAKAYGRAARHGAATSTLRARKEELIRAASRLGA